MPVLYRLRPSLGTLVSVHCRADDARIARTAVEAAFAAIDRVHRLMHPSRAGSDLLAIRDIGVGGVDIDGWTWAVLRAAAQLHLESNGLFDPCVGDCSGTLNELRLVEPNRAETTRPLALDLGGIAKGFAVDRAIDALREFGCSAGEVNAGGDLRVFGAAASEIWIRADQACRPIGLRDEACAVSDASAIARPPEHRGYRRYDSVNGRIDLARAAAVVAPSALWADALATYAVVCRTPAEHRRLDAVLALHDARRVDADPDWPKKSPAARAGLIG